MTGYKYSTAVVSQHRTWSHSTAEAGPRRASEGQRGYRIPWASPQDGGTWRQYPCLQEVWAGWGDALPGYGAAGAGEKAVRATGRMKRWGSTKKPRRDEHLKPQLHRRRAARVCGLGPYWGSPRQWGHNQAAASAQVDPPRSIGRWSTGPMGRRWRGWLRALRRRQTKEAFSATCSLQLPWEVQERTPPGSSCSLALKAQETPILAVPRAGLCFSSFSRERVPC